MQQLAMAGRAAGTAVASGAASARILAYSRILVEPKTKGLAMQGGGGTEPTVLYRGYCCDIQHQMEVCCRGQLLSISETQYLEIEMCSGQ